MQSGPSFVNVALWACSFANSLSRTSRSILAIRSFFDQIRNQVLQKTTATTSIQKPNFVFPPGLYTVQLGCQEESSLFCENRLALSGRWWYGGWRKGSPMSHSPEPWKVEPSDEHDGRYEIDHGCDGSVPGCDGLFREELANDSQDLGGQMDEKDAVDLGRLAEVLRRMYYLGPYADLAYEDDPEVVSREIDRRRCCREQGVQC